MSALYVDSIKDKSDTKTLATLSSSAVTLHTDVTVPASVGSSWVLLNTSSGTNQSSLAFENVMTSTDYNYYKIYGSLFPVTDVKHVYARWGYGGGSTTYLDSSNYINTGYKSYSNGSTSSSDSGSSGEWSYGFYATNVGNASIDFGVFLEYTFNKPWLTNGSRKSAFYTYQKYEENDYIINNRAAVFNHTTALLTQGITAIKFYADGVNISGDLQLYGLKKS